MSHLVDRASFRMPSDPESEIIGEVETSSGPEVNPSQSIEVMAEQPEEIIQQVTEEDVSASKRTVPSSIISLADRFAFEPGSLLESIAKSNMTISKLESVRFLELCKLHSIKFELDKGDTLVFIDYPETSSGTPRPADCFGMAFSSQTLRVHSDKLRATGSSKFADLLNPTYQFRILRRRKLAKSLPEGIKFVLDLTPPSEGDELVFQMTQLSLTPGITNWWASEQLHKVNRCLVFGHDDLCNCTRQPRRYSNLFPDKANSSFQESPAGDAESNIAQQRLPPSPSDLLSKRASGVDQVYETPAYRNIPDYCPVRHRNNIIRLLMMIEGIDVLLDSASRIWTLVALAKIFDCTSVVRDQVAQWIMYGTNTKFIEVLPEEALQIGFALELVQVTQCAFRILVNELAIKEANTDSQNSPSRTTVFGRVLGSLDDELSNIVQHAARAFIDRICLLRDEFQSPDVLERWTITEWTNLQKMEEVLDHGSDETIKEALKCLRILMSAIQYRITNALNQVSSDNPTIMAHFRTMDDDRATYVQPPHFEGLLFIMPQLNLEQRLLCPFIYQGLGDLWKGTLFSDQRSIVKDTPGACPMTFNALALRFHQALHVAAKKNPSLASSEGWNIFYGPSRGQFKFPLVDFASLTKEIKNKATPYINSWMRHDIDPTLNITRHLLLTLNNNELRFLPLWAGGYNDGTGGVFESYLPPANFGPNGPGPAYHTGFTIPSDSSVSGSILDEITMMKIKGSTVAGSVDVQDSISTVYAPGHIIADNVSIASESFDPDAAEYEEARFEVPAEHQYTSHTIDLAVDSLSDVDSMSTITDQDFTADEDIEMESDTERIDKTGETRSENSDGEDSVVVI